MIKITYKLIILFFLSTFAFSQQLELKKIIDLNNPWSLSFISNKEIIVSEKDGSILLINIKNNSKTEIKHNLNYKVDGQG
ncbi:MAG: PQQ-dependent sugar dehydrogenase, partial [Pelagibacteraceae bacterium]